MIFLRCGLASALALFMIVACGAATSSPAPPLVEAGPSDGGPVVAYGGSACVSSCPGAAPANGDACSVPGLQCEYGDFFDPECNTRATCNDTWVVSPPTGACPTPDLARCPASPAHGSSCAIEGDICFYDGGQMCSCGHPVVEAGAAPSALAWGCAQATCGLPRPRIGCGCATSFKTCSYGSCTGLSEYGADLACQAHQAGGAWWTEPFAGGGCVDSAAN